MTKPSSTSHADLVTLVRTAPWRRLLASALALAAVFAIRPASADVSEVMREIERSGQARVIITLRTDPATSSATNGTALSGAIANSGLSTWARARSADEQRAIVANASAQVERSMSAANIPITHRFHTLPFAGAQVTRDQLLQLIATPGVANVQLVRLERAHQVFGRATSGIARAQALSDSVSSIDVPAVWTAGYDGTGLTVAVLDGGFNLGHPMLSGKAIAEACFNDVYGNTLKANCPSGTTAQDGSVSQIGSGAASHCPVVNGASRCDHGSNVASIAVGNDGTNFGVARGAKLLPVDVFSRDYDSGDCSPDPVPCEVTDSIAVLDALDYVNDNSTADKIAAVNMSLGGSTVTGYCDDDSRKAVIDMLRAKGIAVAIAAGNDGLNGQVDSPGCISTAVTVGATDNSTNVASFSDFATTVDVMAPGVSITAASGSNNGLLTLSGTSMATPHVAGAWTLLRQASATATADQIQGALQSTGTAVTRGRTGYTVPRIDVAKALDALNGRNRNVFNQIVSSAASARGQAYLRVFNNSSSNGTLVVRFRDVATGTLLGTWTSGTIPAYASPQIAITTLETNAVPATGQTIVSPSRTAYNLELETSFNGYVQSVLWETAAAVIEDVTSCGNGFATTDSALAMNAYASSIGDYVSHLRVTNTGSVAGAATLSFANATTGQQVAVYSTASIAPGASIDVAEPDVEAANTQLAAATAAGTTAYNVTLGSISGFLQHALDDRRAGAFTNMTSKCALTASSAVSAPVTTTASK